MAVLAARCEDLQYLTIPVREPEVKLFITGIYVFIVKGFKVAERKVEVKL